ncbi:MAG: DEAD/DEAH box helicase [Bryobacterales bacterium]|nr:DEAD/DEAH box helicase [Bryobacterales bacterium]
MAATKQEKRQRQLKEREAEVRRAAEHQEARYLIRQAKYAYGDGDSPFAIRLLKKILLHDEPDPGALDLLAQIHFEAEQDADALYYWNLLLKKQPAPVNPEVLFHSGIACKRLGKLADAERNLTAFLAATAQREEKKWNSLRSRAAGAMEEVHRLATVPRELPRVDVPKPQPAAVPVPVEVEKPPAPKVELTVLPMEAPRLDGRGTLTDFFLRRGLLELKRAQSFEDLICLPSLEGVDAYTYQQETVRKVLRQFQGRALLADEVGLGKTIEACLVLKEYWQRGMARRALILTPPSLVAQWRGELEGKFGLVARVPENAGFRADPERFWREEPLVVASLALARRDSQAAILAGVHWDMVIVDEAHVLKNRTSSNWRLVNSLQKRFLLLLTATPVENNLIELYNLITLLKPGLLETEADFKKRFVATGKPKAPKDPERLRELLADVMIRNTRAVVDVKLPRRIAATVTVTPSGTEIELYERVSRYVSERYGRNGHSRMELSMLQREAGSSPRAISRALERALAERPEAQGELREIAELALRTRESSKCAQLGEILLRESGKAVVFTEFTATLDELAEACMARSIPFAIFRGDLSRADKEAAIARFRDEARVLLSTGAGGEGRNLQFARTVINFDLPWNPMRLEQRIGRVHRIGQTQDVFVFNFCQTGSVEEQLLRVLHDKINMFELVIGEIDAILGRLDDDRDFADVVLDLWASSTGEERTSAFDRLASQLLSARQAQVETEQLDRELFEEAFEA